MRSSQTHYEVLGLGVRATQEQVERAYRFCMSLYGDATVATYSLLSEDETLEARRRIVEAYGVLSDPARRRQYDSGLGGAHETPGPARDLCEVVPFSSGGDRGTGGRDTPEPVAAPQAPPSPPQPPPLFAKSGDDLRRVREARGVTLREISVRSKVGVRFLEYLEQERFDMLPAPVYIRGFLHEYARAVGLDPRRTADDYLARLQQKP
jgi:flagellar biosynthesis protein FlhG